MKVTLTMVAIVLALAYAAVAKAETVTQRIAEKERIICAVFGGYCAQALRVSHCEARAAWASGFPEWARNGQYHGAFQMGSSERARYGDGPGMWAQTRAAYRYFVASGRDWSPWECRP